MSPNSKVPHTALYNSPAYFKSQGKHVRMHLHSMQLLNHTGKNLNFVNPLSSSASLPLFSTSKLISLSAIHAFPQDGYYLLTYFSIVSITQVVRSTLALISMQPMENPKVFYEPAFGKCE